MKKGKAGIMYDTVNFWIDGSAAGVEPFAVLPYLTDQEERKSQRLGYSCSGKLGAYSVYCSERGITLWGSLAAFHLLSNAYTLTRATTAEALEAMSDQLHVDMMAAKVTRLDISTIIPTTRPPSDYFSVLGMKTRYTRLLTHPDTLYYNQKFRQLVFYDKSKEARAKGAVLPPALVGCNLLRYEARWKRPQTALKQYAPVTGETLTDPVFYYNIIQEWKREFDTIKKINPISMKEMDTSTRPKAKNALFAKLLQQAGQSCIDDFIKELKAKNEFSDRKEYSRLKSDLNQLLQAPSAGSSELMEELSRAVDEVAKYAR